MLKNSTRTVSWPPRPEPSRNWVDEAGDVEPDHEQVVVVTERGGDPRRVASGGDHGVAGGQRRLGDVDANAASGAGDQPDLLLSHVCALLGLTGTSTGRGAAVWSAVRQPLN
jgi:hypothetical protein